MTLENLWVIVFACVFATFVWRFAGAATVRYLRINEAFFEWITCVSYAMIGALVVRLIFIPESDLATVPWWIRLVSVLLAFLAFHLARGSLLAGMLAGVGCLTVLAI